MQQLNGQELVDGEVLGRTSRGNDRRLQILLNITIVIFMVGNLQEVGLRLGPVDGSNELRTIEYLDFPTIPRNAIKKAE